MLITGPESTGKSSLAQALAQHYNTYWVPEYARSYLQKLDRPYTQSDLLNIARGQQILEDSYMCMAQDILFVDTDMSVLAIWSQEKYGNIHPWIAQQWQRNSYDMILLMDADLPWVYDPQRENPTDRKRLLSLYRKTLEDKGCHYHLISGKGNKRINNALTLIQEAFNLP